MVVMRSCCCCSTRTGTMLISLLYLLFTLLTVVGLSIMMYYYDEIFKPLVATVVHDLPSDISTELSEVTNSTSAAIASIASVRNVLISSIFIQSLYFFFCLLCLVGASKESAGYMMPWILMDFIRQLLGFCSFVYLSWFTSRLITKWNMESSTLALYCVLHLVVIGLTFYFWLAVIGASQHFRERDRISPTHFQAHQHTKSNYQDLEYGG